MEPYNSQGPEIRRLVFSLFVCSVVTAAVTIIHRVDLQVAATLIPALWGLGALLPGWKGGFPPPVLGLTRSLLLRGFKFYILSSAVIFPLYAFLFYASRHFGFFVTASTATAGIPILKIIVYNIAIVAFFEELFFRGYLFDRLEEASRCLFGEPRLTFWIPVTATAFLFGAAHVAVDLDPARMAVFLPALLFGWLRAASGSLIAPILSHATANAVFTMLIRSV